MELEKIIATLKSYAQNEDGEDIEWEIGYGDDGMPVIETFDNGDPLACDLAKRVLEALMNLKGSQVSNRKKAPTERKIEKTRKKEVPQERLRGTPAISPMPVKPTDRPF